MNIYKCFYKRQVLDVEAETTYAAQQDAAKQFKAKKSYDVTVMLIQKSGEEVVHSTAGL